MRESVAAAWPASASVFEGRCWWMYLDTKKLVTTGVGFLLESLAEAQSLPWVTVLRGEKATADEIAAEYKRVKNLTSLARLGGYAYRTSAKLRLPEAEIDKLLMKTTETFWAGLKRNWPNIENWPADAQLAALDLAWQNGYNFTEVKTNGNYVWPTTRAAFKAEDWTKAANAVPGSGSRHDFRVRLFKNAAKVVDRKLDHDILWNTQLVPKPIEIPVEPTPSDPPPVDVPVTPPVAIVKPERGSKTEWVRVNAQGVTVPSGGFRCTTRSRNMYLEARRLFIAAGGGTPPDITQGGLNAGGVAASAGTHDREAFDWATQSFTARRRKLWELCTWQVGFATWIRNFIANLWPAHTHGVPKGGDLSAGARSQVVQFKQSKNGLAGWGTYSRIKTMGVADQTWEDYLAGLGVSLVKLRDAYDNRKKHSDVFDLQWALSAYLGEDVVSDGDLGPATKKALAKVGPLTSETLAKLGLVVIA